MVKRPFNVDAFPAFALKPLTLGLLEENARLMSENTSLRGIRPVKAADFVPCSAL